MSPTGSRIGKSEADGKLLAAVQKRMAQLRNVLLEEAAAYPGGMDALAGAIGTTPKRLQRAIEGLGTDSGSTGAKLGVTELEAIARLTNSTRILQTQAGPSLEVVPLPAPSVDTQDPRVLFGSALRHFHVAGMAWASGYPAKWAEWLPAMGRMTELLQMGVALSENSTVSNNEMKALSAKHLTFLTSIQHFAAVSSIRPAMLQAVADTAAAYKLVAGRLPSWASGAS